MEKFGSMFLVKLENRMSEVDVEISVIICACESLYRYLKTHGC